MNDPASVTALLARVEGKETVIGIIGLGYVGIPLALAAVSAGFRVVGFDIDKARVEQLNAGRCSIQHIPGALIEKAVREKLFSATFDFDQLSDVDVIIIAVPTPLSKQREPDLSFVEATAETIAPRPPHGASRGARIDHLAGHD